MKKKNEKPRRGGIIVTLVWLKNQIADCPSQFIGTKQSTLQQSRDSGDIMVKKRKRKNEKPRRGDIIVKLP